MGLGERIERLEAGAKPLDRQAQEAEAGQRSATYALAWDELAGTMALEHLDLVVAATESGQLVSAWDGSICATDDAPNLVRIAAGMVSDSVTGWLPGPLALPEHVAQVYVDDPTARRGHGCERCGYTMPLPRETFRGAHGETAIRDSRDQQAAPCALCGGRTGFAAYFMTMQGRIQRCQECGELRPTDDDERSHLTRQGRSTCRCGVTSVVDAERI